MNMLLFFTRGVSIETWSNKGLLHREISIYNKMIQMKLAKKIVFFTYGVNDDAIISNLKLDGVVEDAIDVIPMPKVFNSKLGIIIYSLLAPFIKYRSLLGFSIFKTNQTDGAWTALISSLLTHTPIIYRTGFTQSLFLIHKKKSKLRVNIFRCVEKLMIRYSNYCTVASEEDKSYLLSFNPGLGEKLKVNKNFILTEKFNNKVNWNLRKERFLFVGRLSNQKNLENTIRAVCESGYGLDLYGDGEDKSYLKNFCINNNYDVKFKGVVDNDKLPDIYNGYKFYILCSFYEGMPKTLLEAMACGCVCMVSDVEGSREVVKNETSGFISKVQFEDIRKMINDVSMLDSLHLNSVSNNAVSYINEFHSLESYIKLESETVNGKC